MGTVCKLKTALGVVVLFVSTLKIPFVIISRPRRQKHSHLQFCVSTTVQQDAFDHLCEASNAIPGVQNSMFTGIYLHPCLNYPGFEKEKNETLSYALQLLAFPQKPTTHTVGLI